MLSGNPRPEPMSAFLDSIGFVTGPLTLIAFLAVVVLAIYRRSVNDKRGLEYLYNLLRDKLTRDQFYRLASDVIRRSFWAFIVIFLAGLATYLAAKATGGDTQTVLKVDGTQIITGSGDDTVVHGNVERDLIIGQSARSASPGEPRGNTVVSEPIDESDSQAGVGGDRIFMEGEGNIAHVEGTGNVVVAKGEGNILIATKTGRALKAKNEEFEPDAATRRSDAYRIDVAIGSATTQPLRDLYQLQPVQAFDESLRVSDYPDGVFGFSVAWVVGQADAMAMPWSPLSGGAAKLEMHKRPSGVIAIAAFTSKEQAESLGDAAREEPLDVVLFTSPHQEARHAVSIPAARIETVLMNPPSLAAIYEESLEDAEDADFIFDLPDLLVMTVR